MDIKEVENWRNPRTIRRHYYRYFSHLYLSRDMWSDWAASSFGVGNICFFLSRFDPLENPCKLKSWKFKFKLQYLPSSRLTGLDDRDFDLKSMVLTGRLCRRGDLSGRKRFFLVSKRWLLNQSIYFGIEPLDALDIESKLLRSERLPTLDLFSVRTDGGDESLFLLLKLKFLLPPVEKKHNSVTPFVGRCMYLVWLYSLVMASAMAFLSITLINVDPIFSSKWRSATISCKYFIRFLIYKL